MGILFQFIKYKTMTREEARTFLSGTKVYVEGKSKEIQEKLFSLGYAWGDKGKVVQYEEKPFLFIKEDLLITYSDDVVYFKKESTEREITADEIISIEVTEPYRPFKTQEECWQEMHQHPDFGWVLAKDSKIMYHICVVGIGYVLIDSMSISFPETFAEYEFTDGTPFGIKEE